MAMATRAVEPTPPAAPVKAGPRQRERRNVAVRVKRLLVYSVRLGEALKIDEHGAERDKIFEPLARHGNSPTRGEHRIEIHATGLIDAQRATIDLLPRSVHQRGAYEVVSCIGKAMHC
jgi:hypothetical protein